MDVVNDVYGLAASFKELLFNEYFSDVILVIGEIKIPAHKLILIARSEYFRALLDGGLKESHEREVKLDVPNQQTGRLLLRYLYTGFVDLQDTKFKIQLDLLQVAHKFQLTPLKEKLADILGSNLKLRNVIEVYRVSVLLSAESLEYRCLFFMDLNADMFLNNSSFLKLTKEEVFLLFERYTFHATPKNMLIKLMQWMDVANVSTDIFKNLLDLIDLQKVPLVDINCLNEMKFNRLTPDILKEMHGIVEAKHGMCKRPVWKNLFNKSIDQENSLKRLTTADATLKGVYVLKNINDSVANSPQTFTFDMQHIQKIYSISIQFQSSTEYYVETAIEFGLWEHAGVRNYGEGCQTIDFCKERVARYVRIYVANGGLKTGMWYV